MACIKRYHDEVECIYISNQSHNNVDADFAFLHENLSGALSGCQDSQLTLTFGVSYYDLREL